MLLEVVIVSTRFGCSSPWNPDRDYMVEDKFILSFLSFQTVVFWGFEHKFKLVIIHHKFREVIMYTFHLPGGHVTSSTTQVLASYSLVLFFVFI